MALAMITASVNADIEVPLPFTKAHHGIIYGSMMNGWRVAHDELQSDGTRRLDFTREQEGCLITLHFILTDKRKSTHIRMDVHAVDMRTSEVVPLSEALRKQLQTTFINGFNRGPEFRRRGVGLAHAVR
jgi:hypothetical protein